jgi:hypothetical protein
MERRCYKAFIRRDILYSRKNAIQTHLTEQAERDTLVLVLVSYYSPTF